MVYIGGFDEKSPFVYTWVFKFDESLMKNSAETAMKILWII